MEDIDVNRTEDTKYGWSFLVTIRDCEFEVELESEYWKEVTEEEITPDELVHKSFEFLLDREDIGEILTSFNLNEINRYFPEYEDEVMKIR